MHYRRIGLPFAGGLDEQPALLMAQLEWVARQKNAALAETTERRSHRRTQTRDDG